MDIRWFHHFQELIRRIVFQATDGCSCIEEGNSPFRTESNDVFNVKSFVCLVHEVVPISKEHIALNPPVIVDEVGVIEIHTPPFALRWETAQKQDLCILGQEGFQRMVLHTSPTPGYILRV